jgi:hypothetical protein
VSSTLPSPAPFHSTRPRSGSLPVTPLQRSGKLCGAAGQTRSTSPFGHQPGCGLGVVGLRIVDRPCPQVEGDRGVVRLGHPDRHEVLAGGEPSRVGLVPLRRVRARRADPVVLVGHRVAPVAVDVAVDAGGQGRPVGRRRLRGEQRRRLVERHAGGSRGRQRRLVAGATPARPCPGQLAVAQTASPRESGPGVARPFAVVLGGLSRTMVVRVAPGHTSDHRAGLWGSWPQKSARWSIGVVLQQQSTTLRLGTRPGATGDSLPSMMQFAPRGAADQSGRRPSYRRYSPRSSAHRSAVAPA